MAGALGVGLALVAGCATSGYRHADDTARSLQEAAGEFRTDSRALEASTSALINLVDTPSGDLRIRYESYSRALDELGTAHDRTGCALQRMERRARAYFDTWDKELLRMNDEEVRKRSEARKTEVLSQYETTRRQYGTSRQKLTPLLDNLRDLRKALRSDLTTAGMRAIRPSVNATVQKAAGVQADLTQTASDLEALGVKMSSYALQPTI